MKDLVQIPPILKRIRKGQGNKEKAYELNPEELFVTQTCGKVATRRWRVKKNAAISGSTSSSELLSQHTDSGPPYKSPELKMLKMLSRKVHVKG